jgi:hypothetical protein
MTTTSLLLAELRIKAPAPLAPPLDKFLDPILDRSGASFASPTLLCIKVMLISVPEKGKLGEVAQIEKVAIDPLSGDPLVEWDEACQPRSEREEDGGPCWMGEKWKV